MSSKDKSQVFTVAPKQVLVATMLNGTVDSQFTLMRGVPSNSNKRIEEYYWTPVVRSGLEVQLRLDRDNPLIIDGNTIPGEYRFRNDGTDDEQAVIDIAIVKE